MNLTREGTVEGGGEGGLGRGGNGEAWAPPGPSPRSLPLAGFGPGGQLRVGKPLGGAAGAPSPQRPPPPTARPPASPAPSCGSADQGRTRHLVVMRSHPRTRAHPTPTDKTPHPADTSSWARSLPGRQQLPTCTRPSPPRTPPRDPRRALHARVAAPRLPGALLKFLIMIHACDNNNLIIREPRRRH